MDYIYGKLNKEVEEVTYKGGSTDSAVVTIDHSNKTIYVETKTGSVDNFLSEMSDNAVSNSVVTKKLEELVSNQDIINNDFTLKILSFSKAIDATESTVSSFANTISDFNHEIDTKISNIENHVENAVSKLDSVTSSLPTEEDVNQIWKNDAAISKLEYQHTADINILNDVDKQLKTSIENLATDIQEDISTSNLALITLNEQLTVIKNDISVIQTDIQNMDTASSEELLELSQELNSRIIDIQQQLNDSITVWDDSNEALVNRLVKVEQDVDNLSTNITSIEEYITKTISETTSADIAALKEADEALHVEIELESVARSDADDSLKQLISDVDKKLDSAVLSINEQSAKHSEDIKYVKEYIQSMDNELSQSIRDDLDDAKEELSKEIEDSIKNLEEDHENLSSRLTEVVGNIENISTDISLIKDDLNNHTAENQTQFENIEKLIEDVNKRIDSSSESNIANIDDIEEDLKQIRTSLSSAHSSILSIRSDISSLNAQIDNVSRTSIDNHNKLVLQLGNLTLAESQHYTELSSELNTLKSFVGTVTSEDSVKIVNLVDAIKELHAEYSIVKEDVDVIRNDIEQEVNDAIERFQEAGFYVTVYPVSEDDSKKYVYTSEYGDASKPVVLSNQAEASAVVMRDSAGNIAVTTSASYNNNSAVPKQYVDTNIKNAISTSEKTLKDLFEEHLLIIDGGTSADLIKS